MAFDGHNQHNPDRDVDHRTWDLLPPNPVPSTEWPTTTDEAWLERNTAWQELWTHSNPYAAMYRRNPMYKGPPSLALLAARAATWRYDTLHNKLNELNEIAENEPDEYGHSVGKLLKLMWDVTANPRFLSLQQWKAFHRGLQENGAYSLEQIMMSGRSDDSKLLATLQLPAPEVLVPSEDDSPILLILIQDRLVALEHREVVSATEILDRTPGFPNNDDDRQLLAKILSKMRFKVGFAHGKAQALHHYYTEISTPDPDLSTYLDPLQPPKILEVDALQPSKTLKFITHLRLAGRLRFTSRDLMILPSMQNLGILEISNVPQVTDTMLKDWCLAERPFPQLLILKVFRNNIPQCPYNSLPTQYLAKLPKLRLFKIGGFQPWEQARELRTRQDLAQHDSILEDWHLVIHDPLSSDEEARRMCSSLGWGHDESLIWGYLAHTCIWDFSRTIALPARYFRTCTDVETLIGTPRHLLSINPPKPHDILDLLHGPPVISLGLGEDAERPNVMFNRDIPSICWYSLWRKSDPVLLSQKPWEFKLYFRDGPLLYFQF